MGEAVGTIWADELGKKYLSECEEKFCVSHFCNIWFWIVGVCAPCCFIVCALVTIRYMKIK